MTDIQFGLMIRGQIPQVDDMGVRFQKMVEQVRLVDRRCASCLRRIRSC